MQLLIEILAEARVFLWRVFSVRVPSLSHLVLCYRYHLGVVDYLDEFTAIKKVEAMTKNLLYKER